MSIEPPNPTSKPSSSSKKRLLSPNYKTKQSPNPAQPGPNEEAQQSSLLLSPHKKTRDLPNLSDCHCCGTHINHTNPQDRLLILDSVWRIVLLCRKCLKGIQSCQTCPYCYKSCVVDECVKCGDCSRLIHRDCVVGFGDSSPWFLCRRELGLGGDGFSVCVDCWVPEVFTRSNRIVRKKKVGGSKGGGGGIRRRVDVMVDGGGSMGKDIVLALMAPNYDGSRNDLARASGGLGVERIGGSAKSGGVRGLICYKRQRAGKDGDSQQREGKGGDGEVGAMNESRYFKRTYRTKDEKLGWRTFERGGLKRKSCVESSQDGVSAEVVGTSGHCKYERGSLKREIFVEKIKDCASTEVVGINGTCQYEKGSLNRKIFVEKIKDRASTEVVGINGTCQYEKGSLNRKFFVEKIKDRASIEVVGINGTCQYEKGSLSNKIFVEKIKGCASTEVVGINGTCQYEKGSLNRKIFLENVKDSPTTEVVGVSGPRVYELGSSRRKIFFESIKNARSEVDISGTYWDSTRNTDISVSEVCNLNGLGHLDGNQCTKEMKCDSDVSKQGVADNEKLNRYLVKYNRQAIHKSQLSGQCSMVDG